MSTWKPRVEVTIDGKKTIVPGRAARMVSFIVEKQDEINRRVKGDLTFHFAGVKLSGRLGEIFENI